MSGLAGFDAWLTSPPEGPKWNEPTDEHEAAAMEEIREGAGSGRDRPVMRIR